MNTTFYSTCAVGLLTSTAVLAQDGQDYWPQWRGPLARGASATAKPAVEWSETNNVRWKVAVPGSGISTPVVWGDRIFLLTAIKITSAATDTPAATNTVAATPAPATNAAAGGRPRGQGRAEKPTDNYQFVVQCLDRKNGQTLWQKTAVETVPHEGHHRDHGFASASPVTDGERVYAYFGSRGLHCYDMTGSLKWSKDFGDMQTRNTFGEGSSPTLFGDLVIVNWDDEQSNDFIVALDKRTGDERWRTPRSEGTTWSTPVIVQAGGKPQVVVNGTTTRSYDFKTGAEIWNCAGQTANPIPSIVSDNKILIAMSGFRGASIRAIKLGATGDLENTEAVLWKHNKSTPYVPSPLLVDGLLYFGSGNNAMLSCFDAANGTAHYEAERLDGIFGIYASPVAANGRVYVLGREGVCLVLNQGPKLEVLARNKLDDKTDASIALAGKDLFIRGHQSLYCIAAD
jgi:outer membrane protein assembly factor BamB